MLIYRVSIDGKPTWCRLENGQLHSTRVPPHAGEWRAFLPDLALMTPVNPVGGLDEHKILSPVLPGKIVCVGRNYAEHAAELGNTVPANPLLFFKPPSSVIGDGDTIVLLPEMEKVDHEAELTVVIGKRGRHIPEEKVVDYIYGYTAANDVSDRNFQKTDGQWARAKGFDTFCPVGPCINTSLKPDDVRITCKVNGEIRQDGRTGLMERSIPMLIAYISRIMTLEPGDLVLTGTPAGVSQLHDGDVVQVQVEGIGELRNHVILEHR